MKQHFKKVKVIGIFLLSFLIFFSACNQEKENKSLTDKKNKLIQLQGQQNALLKQIISLQQEINEVENIKSFEEGKLVSLQKLTPTDFQHLIEIQGTVYSKQNVMLFPETNGVITKIWVNEGQNVKQGETLVTIDSEIYSAQLAELNKQYELAKTIFEKQKNLWDQNIGSEVQFLEAKSRKETLEKSIHRIEVMVEKSNIKSPINGIIDEINFNEGEFASTQRQVLRVVNLDEVYVKADATEIYINAIKKNDSIHIDFPALNESRKAKINAVGQVINPVNRTFGIDVKLPNLNRKLKANLLAILKIADYQNPSAIVVPTKWIQQDHSQDFVFIAVEENQQLIARKKIIEKGKTYNGSTEILAGLEQDDLLITEGSNDIADGEIIKTLFVKNN